MVFIVGLMSQRAHDPAKLSAEDDSTVESEKKDFSMRKSFAAVLTETILKRIAPSVWNYQCLNENNYMFVWLLLCRIRQHKHNPISVLT